MIIGLDATPLSIVTGGVARYTWELTLALARQFPEDQYWLCSDQSFRTWGPLPPNLQCAPGPTGALARKWWLWGLPRLLDQLRADVFHGTDFAVPYARARANVMTVHDLSPWRDPNWQPDAGRVRRRTPRLLKWGFARQVITPSEAVRREVIATFGLPSDRVRAVPLAAASQLQVAGPPAPPQQKPYILFVGTLEPRKNVGVLLDAWRPLRDHADLVLAGRVRADFRAPESEPGLHLAGAVSEDRLAELYAGAALCVYPSLYEGFGLPVLEAMQAGVPVITSFDPAILEVSGGAARHVEAGDVAGLTAALESLLQSPEQRADLRQQGLDRAREFSWARTAAATREVYVAALRS